MRQLKNLGIIGPLTLGLCFGCDPSSRPTPRPAPQTSASAGLRNIKELEGCWTDTITPSAQRKQIYTVTGSNTLDLILDVNGAQRHSKVQLKPDGFLVILNQDTLGETLQWVGHQLIFKINDSQVAVFERCP